MPPRRHLPESQGGRTFTGNIWKRDERVDTALGLTFEVDVEILDHRIAVLDGSFSMNHVGRAGAFAVYLSPTCIKLGRIRVPPESTRHRCESTADVAGASFDTTSSHRYRMTLETGLVRVYVDNSAEPILQRALDTGNFVRLPPGPEPETGDVEYEYPYFLVGDNTGSTEGNVSANTDVSASYILDGMRWRRGAYAPREALPPLRVDVPPLPTRAEALTPGIEFDTLPTATAGDATSHFVLGRMEDGVFVDDEAPPSGTVVLNIRNSHNGSHTFAALDGLLGNGAWTLELRVRIDEGTSEEGLAINLWDHIGAATLLITPEGPRICMHWSQVPQLLRRRAHERW